MEPWTEGADNEVLGGTCGSWEAAAAAENTLVLLAKVWSTVVGVVGAAAAAVGVVLMAFLTLIAERHIEKTCCPRRRRTGDGLGLGHAGIVSHIPGDSNCCREPPWRLVADRAAGKCGDKRGCAGEVWLASSAEKAKHCAKVLGQHRLAQRRKREVTADQQTPHRSTVGRRVTKEGTVAANVGSERRAGSRKSLPGR